MIIARTPTRISFFGGGTDYPKWYLENGGSVISTTINKYSYITVRELPPFFNYNHRIRYYEQEEVNRIEEIKHPSVRECAKFLSFEGRLEVVHNADLPAQSGLGSSSTFTVGMLHALYGLKRYMPTKRELATNAIHVEQKLIRENVGSQDQIAAAFGGLNYIRFNRDQNFDVSPIIISKERLLKLENNLMLCFTGFSRSASDLAGSQIAKISKNFRKLQLIADLTQNALDVLKNENASVDLFGELLNQQWQLKKSLDDNISNDQIDSMYDLGMKNGALGGKLLGAGAGGFLIFFASPDKQIKIREKLGDKLVVPFRFEFTGSSIVYVSND